MNTLLDKSLLSLNSFVSHAKSILTWPYQDLLYYMFDALL
jgi:hypothetical protein